MTSKIKALIEILKKNKLKIACAESLTVGYIQTMLGKVSGSSEVFEGGITAYNIEQKVKHLNVNRELAGSVDCVSETVALEMAFGACNMFNTQIGIGTTGYADPNKKNKITPFAYYAIVIKNGKGKFYCHVEKVEAVGNTRANRQKYIAEKAINKLFDIFNIKD